MFGNGAQLLAALRPDVLPHRLLGVLRGLATVRNRTEYEHGLVPRPIESKELSRHLAGVEELVGLAAGGGEALGNLLRML